MGLRELLEEIRARPGLFIGKASAVRLNMFLLGWLHSTGRDDDLQLMQEFQAWLASKLEISPKFLWSEVLTLHSEGESMAFEKFLGYWDEFLAVEEGLKASEVSAEEH